MVRSSQYSALATKSGVLLDRAWEQGLLLGGLTDYLKHRQTVLLMLQSPNF